MPDGDGNYRIDEPRLQHGNERQGEDQAGKGHDNVGQAHEHHLDPAAEIAGKQTDSDAERC